MNKHITMYIVDHMLNKIIIVILIVTIISISINVVGYSYATRVHDPIQILTHLYHDKITGFPDYDIKNYATLPDHYYDNVDLVPHTFNKHVETLNDFEKWKNGPVVDDERDRSTVSNVVHDATLIENINREQYVIEKFIMNASDLEKIIFYKISPNDNNTIHDAVFVIPGSGHQGALDVLGEPSEYSDVYYQDDIAIHLVNEGYIVYVIELRGWGERQIDVGSGCDTARQDEQSTCTGFAFYNHLKHIGIDLNDIQADEITQVLAYIESQDDIDKIAVAGLSLGASHTISQGIINGNYIDALVVASGTGSLLHAPLSKFQGPTDGHLLCCDTVDKLITVAPMPLYVSFGSEEVSIFGWEASTGYTGKILTDVYKLHEMSENFMYYVHDGSHAYHIPSVIDFLDKHL